jgi:bifunctional UDP-N-acetylglucosamine pyrophosphorylase/glucosamine-1-phosphate N-acetyltransferase
MASGVSTYQHPEARALVLAAGQGTRMNSDLAKVLHRMAGRPLLRYVVDTVAELGVERTLVVIGHQRERVRAAFAGSGIEWVEQVEQRGTGHAVMVAAPAFEGFRGTLLVVYGDTPLLTAATLHALLVGHETSGAAVTVLSMRVPDPSGYGRIVRGTGDAIRAIVEERDATPEERRIDEVNSGVCAFDWPRLAAVLSGLGAHNAQGEYYLTDAVEALRRAGHVTLVVCARDYRELLGINTPDQLAEAERAYAELHPGRAGRRERG